MMFISPCGKFISVALFTWLTNLVTDMKTNLTFYREDALLTSWF